VSSVIETYSVVVKTDDACCVCDWAVVTRSCLTCNVRRTMDVSSYGISAENGSTQDGGQRMSLISSQPQRNPRNFWHFKVSKIGNYSEAHASKTGRLMGKVYRARKLCLLFLSGTFRSRVSGLHTNEILRMRKQTRESHRLKCLLFSPILTNIQKVLQISVERQISVKHAQCFWSCPTQRRKDRIIVTDAQQGRRDV
jgi:hypothetical protein